MPLPDASEVRPAEPPAHRELKEPPPQPEGRLAPEGRGDPDLRVSREAEDYLSSLLAGCLRGAEDSPSGEEDDPDLLPDLSPDEASYSLQDDPPSPSDGSLSLDDLARRIEVAEVSARPGWARGEGSGCATHCAHCGRLCKAPLGSACGVPGTETAPREECRLFSPCLCSRRYSVVLLRLIRRPRGGWCGDESLP